MLSSLWLIRKLYSLQIASWHHYILFSLNDSSTSRKLSFHLLVIAMKELNLISSFRCRHCAFSITILFIKDYTRVCLPDNHTSETGCLLFSPFHMLHRTLPHSVLQLIVFLSFHFVFTITLMLTAFYGVETGTYSIILNFSGQKNTGSIHTCQVG